MCGLLFGYGGAQIVRRHQTLGPRRVRRLLLAGAWMVRWRDRWLLVLAGLFFLATMLTERAEASVFVSLVGPLGFVCPFAVGLWAGGFGYAASSPWSAYGSRPRTAR